MSTVVCQECGQEMTLGTGYPTAVGGRLTTGQIVEEPGWIHKRCPSPVLRGSHKLNMQMVDGFLAANRTYATHFGGWRNTASKSFGDNLTRTQERARISLQNGAIRRAEARLKELAKLGYE